MNNRKKGELSWYIPDGYIPPLSSGDLVSHESICVLNCNNETAHLKVTIYFEDRPPLEEIPYEVKGKRTSHIRTSSLEKDGEKIPVEVPYAIEVQSDIPIIVQYSRLDSTQKELALMSTMAFPIG
ncbi:sensory rhodopsin transducer [Halalkalibacter akibai]|uniref:L-rhamnose mutarotase n=1 Tax=Halalkalibacter akibai (strain ATCC 43226 / DSM 21942 / CIP 109018 / JCM 9157 / 1139) TaxID=1236973 RepID=W4QVR9_HALA3|nr:sensory rhodopsin transducer [Halalkalibacter akibai]GAE36201.1 L-rhamnose mutarotase [Halalkalibacter akibai JCM 9157]